ncbi:hypothetical protein E1182_06535 [Micromonospora sp. KC721]|nr:hypothetical protein E1182_06535 [Micromonospora sp. KC721]
MRRSASARSLRPWTDIRFATLIAAVLASSVVALSVIHVATPSLERLNRERVDPCLDGITAAVAPLRLTFSDSVLVRGWLTNQCMEPFFHQQAKWVGLGLLAQLVLAGMLYALHPWWLGRRRRLTRLASAGNADVLAELDGLARQAGLPRPPLWLLAPYAGTHGGQAFGLPRRRRVCLDVGLLLRYDTDRAGFRAVIRHELGHLHNRDVDRTYLTIAIWWSFVASLVAPLIALSLNPDVLRRPQQWSWSGDPASSRELLHRLVALLFLTAVVYLARNAILRSRELHADVVAAGWESTDGALRRVVRSLPWPPQVSRFPVPRRWRGYGAHLGTHPDPRRRVAAMDDPDRLARTSGWELAGLGLVTALVLNNISLFVGNLMGRYLVIGLVLLALPAGALLVGALVSALRQVDAPHRGQGPSRRDAVLLPIAVAAGFATGGPLSLLAADTNLGGFAAGPVAFAVNTTLLVTGFLLISAWTRSVGRSLDESSTGGHRAVSARVVTATAVAVGAPMFALWYFYGYGTNLFMTFHGQGWPATGWAIEWYSTLADTIGGLYVYQPLLRTRQTPLASLGMVLLWAVPAVLLSRRHRDSRQSVCFRRAAAVGAIAGLVAVIAAIAIPYAAQAVLPTDVRRIPDEINDEVLLHFPFVHMGTYLAVAALLQAVAAAVVAAMATRLRPVLVPLTVTTTAVLSTAGLYVSWAVSSCINLVASSKTNSCRPMLFLPDEHVDVHLHFILVWGAAAAIPVALISAGIAALWRRLRPTPPTAPVTDRHHRRRLAAGVLGALGTLVIAAAAVAVPDNIDDWTPGAAPSVAVAPPDPGQPPSAPTIDPCLIGTWRETSHRTDTAIGFDPARFTSSGTIQTFTAEGVATLDTGTGVTETAIVGGHLVEVITTGSITARYHTDNGVIRYDDEKVARAGTVTIKVNGSVRGEDPLTADLSDERYACSGDTLRQINGEPSMSSQYAVELNRT